MLKKPKEKGRRLELHIAELLRGYGFSDTYRQPLSGGIEGMKGDIRSKTWPFFTEVKNCETWKPLEWYKKAASECGSLPPVIIMSKNREEIYCFLLMSDFINAVIGEIPIKKKFVIPQKPQRLTLEETSQLPFSKAYQARRPIRK